MKLLVPIVNYRRADLTIDCLRSAVPQARGFPGGCRLAVCENGSGAGQAEMIRQAIHAEGWGDVVELFESSTNRGFTGGNNVLIEPWMNSPTPPEFVLLLNNDTIVRPGAFAALVRFMHEHPACGIAGSRLEDPDGTVQVSAFRFPGIMSGIEEGCCFGPVSRVLGRWSVAPPAASTPHRADWLAGASVIIRRSVIEKVGLLDEGFWTYFDDVDYCWNAKKAGFEVWYAPDSRVVHLVGQTSNVTSKGGAKSRRPAYWYAARRRYYTKNYGAARALAVDATHWLAAAMGKGISLVRRRESSQPARYLRDLFAQSAWVCGTRPNVVEPPR